ncbi:MAG: pilus assembly protein [Solirubrobacteraceae bacterium]
MRGERGQASVELVGVLPLVVIVGALLWQAVLTGQAVWLSGSAARAAARAAAVGGDPAAAARRTLPPRLERGLRVRAGDGVRVVIGVPAVIGGGTLTRVAARAGFPEQSP